MSAASMSLQTIRASLKALQQKLINIPRIREISEKINYVKTLTLKVNQK